MNTLRYACVVASAALGLLAACDDAHVNAPPPVSHCPELIDYLHIHAVARPPGMAVDGALSGAFLCTANGSGGVFGLDISDPSDVHVTSALDTLHDARAIDTIHNWLLVADGMGGLVIVDASNHASLQAVNTLRLPGAVVDVRVEGTRAYLANDALGLVIVDVSDPPHATVLGLENTPGNAVSVAAAYPLAFLLEQPAELRVINAVDPSAPFIIQRVSLPGFAEGVDAGDGFVAVAVGQTGVQLVDVSHPSQPVLAGLVDTPVDARSVAVVGNSVFVADTFGGALMLDARDIAHPEVSGYLGAVSDTRRVRVSHGNVVMADGSAGARVYSATPPTPAPVDSLAADGDIVSLSPLGNLVVVADHTFGLHVIDPARRTIVGTFPMVVPPRDVFVADSVAYVAPEGGQIAIVDLHDPAMPQAAGEFGSGETTDHIVTAGDFGYLLDETGWLYEEPIHAPPNPRIFHDIAVIWTSVTADTHFPFGTFLYVPNARGTVLIIAASSMNPVNELPVSASPQRVVIRHYDGPLGPDSGRLAYVAETGFNNGQAGVEVFDVTDVSAPALVGKFTTAGNASDIAFAGSQMVVGEAEDGAEVFDLLDTARARPSGLLVGPARRVAVGNGTLVTAGGKRGALLLAIGGCVR